MTKISIEKLIILFIALFIALQFLPNSTVVFDNFNKAAIGLAALITAYFGSTYFIENNRW